MHDHATVLEYNLSHEIFVMILGHVTSYLKLSCMNSMLYSEVAKFTNFIHVV